MGNSFSIPMPRVTKSGVACFKSSPTEPTRLGIGVEVSTQRSGSTRLPRKNAFNCLGYSPTPSLSRRGEIPHKDRTSLPTLGVELSRRARSPRPLASPLIGVRLRCRIFPRQGSSCWGYSVEVAATTAVGSLITVRYGNTLLHC
jgi:hypothetical protein